MKQYGSIRCTTTPPDYDFRLGPDSRLRLISTPYHEPDSHPHHHRSLLQHGGVSPEMPRQFGGCTGADGAAGGAGCQ